MAYDEATAILLTKNVKLKAEITTLRAEVERLRAALRNISTLTWTPTDRETYQDLFAEAQNIADAALEEKPRLCDCERSHNGMGMVGRECDCKARGTMSRDPTNPFAPMEKAGWTDYDKAEPILPLTTQEKQDG